MRQTIIHTHQDSLQKTDYESFNIPKRYAPWIRDSLFLDQLNQLKKYSLVGEYRFYELWTLVEQSAKLLKGSLIEIGVWKGGTGALMAHKASLSGISEPVYLCDTFAGVVKAGYHDTFYKGGEHNDVNYDEVCDLIQNKLGLTNTRILKGIFPDDTSHLIEDKYFRFAHIDVDVYQSAKDIYDWLWDKMVVGGIIVYDDYGFPECQGVTQFVNEQMNDTDKHIIYNLNGHAVVIKIA